MALLCTDLGLKVMHGGVLVFDPKSFSQQSFEPKSWRFWDLFPEPPAVVTAVLTFFRRKLRR